MRYTIEDVLRIVKQLRDPETGCEWDRVQHFSSLTVHTKEEMYELLDAIEQQDFDAIKSELGDLLYHLIFYARLAEEAQQFDWAALVDSVAKKLIHRHPKQFPTADHHEDRPVASWEQRKQQERSARALTSLLDDIPAHQPALMRAQKMQKRCATIGFDWPSMDEVMEKVQEEHNEVAEVLAHSPIDAAHLEEEIGDLLFSVVNLARHAGLDAEQTLQRATNKFERRFRYVETALQAQKVDLSDQCTAAQLNQFWLDAKAQEIDNKEKNNE